MRFWLLDDFFQFHIFVNLLRPLARKVRPKVIRNKKNAADQRPGHIAKSGANGRGKWTQ